jgi:hypothetical protein
MDANGMQTGCKIEVIETRFELSYLIGMGSLGELLGAYADGRSHPALAKYVRKGNQYGSINKNEEISSSRRRLFAGTTHPG